MITLIPLIPMSSLATYATGPYNSWSEAGQNATQGSDYSISSSVYTIYTAKGLAWIAYQTISNSAISGFQGKTVLLANDINLDDGTVSGYNNTVNSTNSWIPIGLVSYGFKGTFDGQGYSISNLKINTSSGYQGLFGAADVGAVIKNVGISSGSVESGGYAAGIVAIGGFASIINCYNNASIKGKWVGGITGMSYNLISSCYNTGTIESTDEASTIIAGIVGYLGLGNTSGSAVNCYNAGLVSGSSIVGGIAGYGDYIRSMLNCYNTGTIAGINSGGILGSFDGSGHHEVNNCVSLGNMISGQEQNIGRFVGVDMKLNSYIWLSRSAIYAWEGQIIHSKHASSPDTEFVVTNGSVTNQHGVDISCPTTGAISMQFSEIFNDDAAWTFTENKLPILRGVGGTQSSALPSWITPSIPVAPVISTVSLSDGMVGVAYSQTLTATGTTPITWSAISGSLPPGLTLNSSTGVISGTPTATATAIFTVKAANSTGNDEQQLTITIAPASTALFTAQYTKDQLFDVQRSPAFPIGGSIFRLGGLKAPYNQNLQAVSWAAGDYVKFEYISSVAALSAASQTAIANSVKWYYSNPTNLSKAAVVKEVQYSSGGSVKATLSNYGLLWALDSNYGFLYTALGGAYSNSGGIGTFVSFKPYAAGSIVTYKPATSDPVSLSAITAVSSNEVPANGTTGGITTASISGKIVNDNKNPVSGVNITITYGGITGGAVTDNWGQYIVNFSNVDPSTTTYAMTIASGSSVSAIINGTIDITTGSGFGTDDQISNDSAASGRIPLMPYQPAPNPTVVLNHDFTATVAAITTASGITLSAASLSSPASGTVNIQIATGFDSNYTYYRVLPSKPEAPMEGALKQGNWTHLASSTASISASNGSYVELIVTDINGTILSWGVSGATSDGYQAPSSNSSNNRNRDESDSGSNSQNPIIPGTTGAPGTPGYKGNSGEIVIGNKPFEGGTAKDSKSGDKTITTVTFDEKKFGDMISGLTEGDVIRIPIYSNSDEKKGEFSAGNLKDLGKKGADLVIQSDDGSFTLPAGSLDLDGIAAYFKKQNIGAADPKDIKIAITIGKGDAETQKILGTFNRDPGFKVVVPPLKFLVTAEYQGKIMEYKEFGSYVERFVTLPKGTDPKKITSAVVVDSDGRIKQVPTRIIFSSVSGQYSAVVRTLTNQTFALVTHKVEFPDVANRWSKEAVNDMGSRMIISGINGLFYPDRSITRAEFVSIMVNALGLPAKDIDTDYSDLELSRWFTPYAETAISYGLAGGISQTRFGATDNVNRQQAMNMIARAMQFTGIYPKMSNSEVDVILSKYTDSDQISEYARISVAACLKSGAVKGKTATTIDPRASINRAEVASIIRRLLQKSNLI